MDSDEELDLETLTQLLDEANCEDNYKPTEPIIKSDYEFLKKEQTQKIDTDISKNKCANECSNVSNQKPKKSILQDAVVDIFSVETNVPDLIVNKKLTPECKNNAELSLNLGIGSTVHSGDTDSSDDERTLLTESGKMIKNKIKSNNKTFEDCGRKTLKSWKSGIELNTSKASDAGRKKESFMTDNYSGIRIINPLVSATVMESRMTGRKMVKMSFIRNCMRGGDIEGDWVTVGIVVNKVPPKTSKNGKTFSIWKLTDLNDCDKLVGVFLFGAAHAEHWKTAIGTVVGILNPSIMPDKDSYKSESLSLSVDHPGKLMIMGTSKDFGYCRGRRKDGLSCTFIVNMSQCEYCVYHVKKEYKKLSSKRTELQATYSGKEPNLKNRVLNGQSVMYGGQLYSPSIAKKASASTSKDKLTLNSLKLKRKAEAIENEGKTNNLKKFASLYGAEVQAINVTNSSSEFINQRLAIPSIGSRNLLQHLIKDETENVREIKSVTPKELLKLHEQELKEKRMKLHKSDAPVKKLSLQSKLPQLGRGYQSGDEISFDVCSPVGRKTFTSQELAKLRAIQSIKEKGPLEHNNPNAVKKEISLKTKERIKRTIEELNEADKGNIRENAKQPEELKVNRNLLGNIDMNSEKFKKYLSRKSSHAYETEMEEIEKQETYFSVLEKKEQMEQKMESLKEIVCNVVSCKVCRYTAHQATDYCKSQSHPIQWHKATKRFFYCTNCKHRTCSFTKLPTKECRNCGGSSFARTTMMKPRTGPKLDSEKLLIRGEEVKFLNSMKS